jgi:LacI family gluconate utilization system Gnt-I transcriptional repressor
MRDAGAPVPAERLAEVPISMDGGRAGIRQLLAGRPRAVFCSSDVLAAGALLECQRQGLAVPADIAIAGYDDLDIAAHLRPSLTTVRVPRFGIGERAAQMIDDALAGRPVRPRSVDMGYEIMMRESA